MLRLQREAAPPKGIIRVGGNPLNAVVAIEAQSTDGRGLAVRVGARLQHIRHGQVAVNGDVQQLSVRRLPLRLGRGRDAPRSRPVYGLGRRGSRRDVPAWGCGPLLQRHRRLQLAVNVRQALICPAHQGLPACGERCQ